VTIASHKTPRIMAMRVKYLKGNGRVILYSKNDPLPPARAILRLERGTLMRKSWWKSGYLMKPLGRGKLPEWVNEWCRGLCFRDMEFRGPSVRGFSILGLTG
jgi:hypothetical protein